MAPFDDKPLRRFTVSAVLEEPAPPSRLSSWTSRLDRWFKFGRGKEKILKSGTVEKGDPKSPALIDPRVELYVRMVGDREPNATLALCWSWYLKFLDERIREAWHTVLAPTIEGLSSSFTDHDAPQIAKVYEVLVIIADAICTRSEISLDIIIESLGARQGLMKAASQDEMRHLVWSFSGHLTMLFDPEVENPLNEAGVRELKLRRPLARVHARNRHRGAVITSLSEDTKLAEEQFHEMLSNFGSLLPKPGCLSSTERRSTSAVVQGDIQYLNVAYICLDGLKKVANIHVEWVNTLELHLQLDQRKRILRLFRFPALCLLLHKEQEKGFLCQLFMDHTKSQVQGEDMELDLTFSDYLREVILSYRLLFGIDQKSHQAFRNEAKNWQVENSDDNPCSLRRRYDKDPLLWQLCTTSASSARSGPMYELLDLLDGEETSSLFAVEDFPFLGKRLAELQRFAVWQKPNNWKTLWQDQRDVKDWWIIWTAWAVLLVGGGTIILQFVQAVAQVWSTVLQVRSSGNGPNGANGSVRQA